MNDRYGLTTFSVPSPALFILLLGLLLSGVPESAAEPFAIARVKYSGGGDWYTGKTSIPNLLRYARTHTPLQTAADETVVELTDDEIYQYPFLFLTGHGRVHFTDNEVESLRAYLAAGGFLYVDDDYGLDKHIRRELARVFPDQEMQEVPFDHPVFHAYYDFPDGLPKIHEHDGKPPRLLALFQEGRIAVLYTWETDLGDGWEDADIHKDPEDVREAAFRMGVNLIYWRLTHP